MICKEELYHRGLAALRDSIHMQELERVEDIITGVSEDKLIQDAIDNEKTLEHINSEMIKLECKMKKLNIDLYESTDPDYRNYCYHNYFNSKGYAKCHTNA